MTEKGNIYKCELCGNIIEVLTAADGNLQCCGNDMVFVESKSAEQGQEKHLPVLEATAEGDLVKVGDVAHPMEDKHYIEWISVKTADGKIGRKFLNAGDQPQAVFEIEKDKIVELVSYCNVHGLWSSKIK